MFISSGVLPTFYKVYYSNTAGSSTPIEKQTTGTSILLDNLAPDSTYKFWIVPYAGSLVGVKSPETSVTVPRGVCFFIFAYLFCNFRNV